MHAPQATPKKCILPLVGINNVATERTFFFGGRIILGVLHGRRQARLERAFLLQEAYDQVSYMLENQGMHRLQDDNWIHK